MKNRVSQYIENCEAIWTELSTVPQMPKNYSSDEKCSNQAFVETLAQSMSEEKNAMKDPEVRERATGKIKLGMKQMFERCFGFTNQEMKIIMNDEFAQSTKDFMRMAREFDPEISIEDIFQASRNLWIANTIQQLMGLKPEITPSLFAYSMLYPYTDNYLDDPKISSQQKIAFSTRFRMRLAGERVIADNKQEWKIFSLVTMIEKQWDRATYADLFNSLLAIHDAQTRSIGLLNQKEPPSSKTLMNICIDKGGTSVLADGYLVKGDLTPDEEYFMFLFGVWLQFIDDIQDVNDDIEEQVTTAFTQAAQMEQMTDFTLRTLSFGYEVERSTHCFTVDNLNAITGIMHKSIAYLAIEAVAMNEKYHRPEELIWFEKHSPMSFEYIRKRRKKMAGNRLSIMKKMDTLMAQSEKKSVLQVV